MSDHDNERSPSIYKDRSSFWSLAALSTAALLCSVLGARFLAELVDQGDTTATAANRSDLTLRQLAASAPRPQPRETVTIVRSIGVDGVTTATIPQGFGPALAPCGDKAK